MKLRCVFAGAAALVSCSPALAAPNPPGAPFIVASDVADAPDGFNRMCVLDHGLCNELGIPEDSALTRENGAQPRAEQPGAAAAQWTTGALKSCTLADCGGDMPVAATEAATNLVIAETAAITPTPPASDVPAAALPRDLRKIARLNARLNHRIRQIADIDLYGVDELWRRPTPGRAMAGDCEDIAIEKRVELIEAGIARERLAFAVVYAPGFGLHTVLVVRMADGDYVLDSMTSRVVRWDQTRYSWLRVESRDHPGVWQRIAA